MSSGRWVGIGVFVSLAVCLQSAPTLRAAAPENRIKEIREFEVLLKGKPTGTTRFTIEQQPDGRTVVTTDAVVRVNLIVYSYVYEFHGTENWGPDRLESFYCHGTDGGKKFSVAGTIIGPGKSQTATNNKSAEGPAYATTSNYWRLPLRTGRDEMLSSIDASTGVLQRIRVSAATATQVPVGNTTIPASEYHLTGDVDVKLSLDRDGRIVRLQSIEQGYPTELRLIRISRVEAAAEDP